MWWLVPAARECRDNLLAVEASIFDEDLTRMIAADHDSGEKYTGHIAFVRLRIHLWLICRGVERDAEGSQKFEVGVIPGQRKNLSGRQRVFAGMIRDPHVARLDGLHVRLQKRADLAGLDAVLDVRPHPIFDRRAKLGATVHESYVGTQAVNIESGFRR